MKSIKIISRAVGWALFVYKDSAYKITRAGYIYSYAQHTFKKAKKFKHYKVCDLMLTIFKRAAQAGETAKHIDGNSSNNSIENLVWTKQKTKQNESN